MTENASSGVLLERGPRAGARSHTEEVERHPLRGGKRKKAPEGAPSHRSWWKQGAGQVWGWSGARQRCLHGGQMQEYRPWNRPTEPCGTRPSEQCGWKSQRERGHRQPKACLQSVHREKGKKQSSGRVLAGKSFGVLNGKVSSPAARAQWGKGNGALYIHCRKIGVHQTSI